MHLVGVIIRGSKCLGKYRIVSCDAVYWLNKNGQNAPKSSTLLLDMSVDKF